MPKAQHPKDKIKSRLLFFNAVLISNPWVHSIFFSVVRRMVYHTTKISILCFFHHPIDINPVSHGGIVGEDVCDSSDQFPVL